MTGPASSPDLAVVVPALNEARNLEFLLPALTGVINETGIAADVIIVDGGSADDTATIAAALGARVVRQTRRGYGAALLDGFRAATAPFVLTMDADLSHRPTVLRELWAARHQADVIVASRYVRGGASQTHWLRRVLSRILNTVYARALSMPLRDISSGFRLYRRSVLDGLTITSLDFDVLPEILTRIYAEGYRIAEVPFQFASRGAGRSHVRLARFAWSYVKTLWRLWRLRNSIESADYDHRAFDSAIPLQRYWQRSRYRIVHGFLPNGDRLLDVGCGSSRILRDLPGAVGVDVLLRKLRFLRPAHPEVVQASVGALPFAAATFEAVICSEVIEHVPDTPDVLAELTRVLRPGGTLVLGTPDYGRRLWHVVEWVYGRVAPGGYAHEHITHFERAELERRLATLGYEVLACRYVGGCEMILKARRAR
ncbi:MAG: glycosyltransferase [Candidatus Rokubacteria bacterium]|nr:glycosyltransferase [Candidatus Rokubacteria bacterium]